MIFWILLITVIAAVVIAFIWGVLDWGVAWGFATSLIAALIGVLVGTPLMFLALLIPGEKMTQETFDLRAIGSSSTVQGRFYLGSGYVEGRRTLNYIAEEDGYSRLGQGIASGSRVYEDTNDPTVTEYTAWYSNGWVIPWEFVTGHAWDFHVPAGSILEDFTITNE